MSVDVFGRQLNQSKSRRGPPGVGYKLTADGQYDVENKRLCNVAEPLQLNDVVNLVAVRNLIHSEIHSLYEVTSALRKSLDDVELAIQMFKDENAEKLKKVDLAISELYEILFKNSKANNDDTSDTSGRTS